uniref:Uncharacterized protein n=1 Tax=Dulem virus 40 TaxID=3145758 RepID=A0AAU8AUL1_9CAUD
MIRQTIYLERAHGWRVTCYYAVTHYEVEEIMAKLIEIGCHGKKLQDAYDNLSSGNPNSGICYSGYGESVWVVTVTTDVDEFADSLDHEKHHLAVHIADILGWDLRGEEVCYLAGEIGRKMRKVSSKFLCEHCRCH